MLKEEEEEEEELEFATVTDGVACQGDPKSTPD